jgi:hypothetical protein
MSDNQSKPVALPPRISLDVWAVALALTAALLVRFDLIRNVKW